jgi:hypothetical protein
MALAAAASAAWFLPPLPARVIKPVRMPASDWFSQPTDGVTVFHNADELHQAMPALDHQALPDVDWESTDLVWVRCQAAGYRPEGCADPRYGTLELSSRRGGTRLFAYLYEPMPFLLWGEVHRVFSKFYRESWWSVPKGTPVHWGKGELAQNDLEFAALTVVSLLACALIIGHLRRLSTRPCAGQRDLRGAPAAALSAG